MLKIAFLIIAVLTIFAGVLFCMVAKHKNGSIRKEDVKDVASIVGGALIMEVIIYIAFLVCTL